MPVCALLTCIYTSRILQMYNFNRWRTKKLVLSRLATSFLFLRLPLGSLLARQRWQTPISFPAILLSVSIVFLAVLNSGEVFCQQRTIFVQCQILCLCGGRRIGSYSVSACYWSRSRYLRRQEGGAGEGATEYVTSSGMDDINAVVLYAHVTAIEDHLIHQWSLIWNNKI